MNILITGGTGLVGGRLCELLRQKGYSVSLLSRSKTNLSGEIKTYHWNPDRGELDDAALRHADFIINLAGASVADKRWTAKRKEEIYNSRVAGTMLLSKKLQALQAPLKAFINASAAGYYGDQGDQWLTETTPAGNDFLAQVCKDWEAQAQTVAAQGIRTVICRIGIVLSRKGGALHELEKPLQFGVAPYLGDGKQYYAWVHLDDLCRALIYAVENETLSGVYNVAGNQPIPNRELIEAIRKAKDSSSIVLPAPAFALKIVLGNLSQTVLSSQRLSNEKLLNTGFKFNYATLQHALTQLYS